MISAQHLSSQELAALLAFHAEAGVEVLLEDAPIDRIAQFAAERAARAGAAPGQPVAAAARPSPERAGSDRSAGGDGAAPSGARASVEPAPGGGARPGQGARPATAGGPVIPNPAAAADARFAAESARSLEELRLALETFSGCNLKASARHTIFLEGPVASGLLVIGPMPSADDDREGLAFSGRAGQLLDRMLAAIGLSRDRIMLTTAIPWRPPGDSIPSPAQMEICRPFIERQIALAEPQSVLLLGNFTSRLLLDPQATIHALRGQWRPLQAGGHATAALATFHPQDLLQAPATKAMAWRDLMTFRDGPAP